MRTASTSLPSVRALGRVLLATVVVGFGLAAVGLLRPAPTDAAGPIWACYSNSNHSLRSVGGPGDCAAGETAVRLDDSDHPIWICLHPQPGHIRFAGDADADPITGNCWGAGQTTYFQLPGDKAIIFCVQPPNGVLTYTPDTPCGGNATRLEIPARNRAPVAQDKSASVNEDASVQITLSATDADGNALTFAIAQQPANGSLSAVTGTSCTGSTPNSCTANVTYTPNANFNGSDSFTYKANDTLTDSNTATVSITVNPVNDAPTDIALDNASVAENQPAGTLVGSFSTTDVDNGDTFTYTLVAGTGSDDNGDFQIAGNQLQTAHGLNFEPKPVRSIRVRSTDAGGLFTEKQFTITVTDVNEQPTAIALSDNKIGENRPAGFTVGILSTTDPDNGDTFTYTLVAGPGSDDNASFQIAGDRLESAVVFDFETKSSYTVRVRTTDSGGLFTEQQFTITIVDRNDNPTDIALSNSAVDENVPANTVVGTFSTTDQDAGDTFTYTLVTGTGDTDNAAFNINGSDLRITNSPNFEAKSSYSIRVRTDDGHGGTFEKVFTITVNDLNEAPTAGTDTYDAIGNTQLRINTPTGPATSVAFTTSGTSPLANDTDPDTNPAFNSLQITAVGTCSKGGTLNLNTADHTAGKLTYLPPQGIESASASDTDDCSYTLSDGTNSVSGTIKVKITDMVWYVDNTAAAGGDGRSTAVFNSLAPLTTGGSADGLDNANDYIFVFQGNGTYTGGLALETGQRLFGQPNGLTVGATTLIAGSGSNPTLTNGGGAGITLANGVDVERVNVANTSGAGIAGTGVTSATIGGNTSITNTGGNGFDLSGAAGGTVNVGASISNTGGKQVSIQNRTSGTVTLTGAVTGTGTGVALSSNTGAAIAFSAQLTLSTGTANAFTATGGGSVSSTNTTSTLTTTTGTALSVTNTNISASGLNFKSISSNGAASGIVLNTTGSSGGLTVLGDGGGSSDHSGGQILASTGPGVSLINTATVSLGYMDVKNGLDDGIHGEGVGGFTLDRSNVTTNGDSTSDDGIQIGLESGSTVGVTGAVSITNSAVSGNAHNNVHIRDTSGTISSLTVTGSSFNDLNDTFGANSFLFEGAGTSALTAATFSGNTVQNNAPQRGLEVQAHDTATVGTFTVSANTLVDNGIQASFTQDGSANLTFKFLNNGTVATPMTGSVLQAINVFSSSQATGGAIVGTISGNVIGNAAVAGSGSTQGGGISVLIQGQTDSTLLIDGNTIRQVGFTSGSRGIDAQFRGPTTTGLGVTSFNDLTITNNTVQTDAPASTFPLAAVYVAADNQGSPAQVRADIRDNTVPSIGSFDAPSFDGNGGQLIFESVNGGVAQLVDNPPASADATAEIQSHNTGNVYANGVTLIAGPINVPS
jgi:hypothetical protein